MKKINQLTLTALLLLVFSCSSNDMDEVTVQIANQAFAAKINGQNFIADEDAASASFIQFLNSTNLVITGAKREGLIDASFIVIGINVEMEDYELQSNTAFNLNDEKVILTGAVFESIEDFADSELDEMLSMTVEITNVNAAAKTISGRFNFESTLTLANGSKKTYNVTNGVFNDLSYEDD